MSLIPIVALLAFALLTARAFTDLRSAPVNPTLALDNAIRITRQRVDRGEIDREEYERVVSILRS